MVFILVMLLISWPSETTRTAIERFVWSNEQSSERACRNPEVASVVAGQSFCEPKLENLVSADPICKMLQVKKVSQKIQKESKSKICQHECDVCGCFCENRFRGEWIKRLSILRFRLCLLFRQMPRKVHHLWLRAERRTFLLKLIKVELINKHFKFWQSHSDTLC